MYERYCMLRDLKGFSDSQVAQYCGFSKSTLSDWKSGKGIPKTDKIIKIAECLGVSLDYLALGKESEFTASQAEFDLKISQDLKLKEMLKKYYSLSEKKQKYVADLIDLLSEEV